MPATVALLLSRRCRRVAAVASPPSCCRRHRPRRRHPRCRRCHHRRRCRRRLMDAMVKKYVRVGRWHDDGRQRHKRQRLWLRLQYAQNCRYDDVGRCGPTNDIGTPGKRRSPPPHSIFRAAPLGSRRGNRTSHLGGDAARRTAAAPARARGQALHKPVPSHRQGQQHSCYDVYGREVVRVLMFFSRSLKEDLRTLPPVEIGIFPTYLHTHMPKIKSSPVKILKRSWKVPGKFSKLGLKKISIVRSAVVLSTDVSTVLYLRTVYLSTDVSTAQYLRTK